MQAESGEEEFESEEGEEQANKEEAFKSKEEEEQANEEEELKSEEEEERVNEEEDKVQEGEEKVQDNLAQSLRTRCEQQSLTMSLSMGWQWLKQD